MLDSNGKPKSDSVANLFDGFLHEFERWIVKHAGIAAASNAA